MHFHAEVRSLIIDTTQQYSPPDHRWKHNRFYRWWRSVVVGSVDQEQVIERIVGESGWSGRYLFMRLCQTNEATAIDCE